MPLLRIMVLTILNVKHFDGLCAGCTYHTFREPQTTDDLRRNALMTARPPRDLRLSRSLRSLFAAHRSLLGTESPSFRHNMPVLQPCHSRQVVTGHLQPGFYVGACQPDRAQAFSDTLSFEWMLSCRLPV